MCGITGYIGDSASQNVVTMLEKLEYRGYDSAGVATLCPNGSLDIRKGTGYLSTVVSATGLCRVQGSVSIGHVRWATHGKVSVENAHPFADCSGNLAIVHNGIIDNCDEIRTILSSRHTFTSDTDSELIAHLIEQQQQDGASLIDAVVATIGIIKGSYAIVVISPQLPDMLLVARLGSPLICGWSRQGEAAVASDYLALGEEIDCILDVPERVVVPVSRKPDLAARPRPEYTTETPSKGKHEYYMLSEIYEQPETFSRALKQDRETLRTVAIDLLRSRYTVFTACGTSRFAALIGRFLFSTLADRMSEVVVGSEFQHFAKSLGDGSAVIAISQSGETADVISGIEVIRNRPISVVSITNRQMSRLEAISDRVLRMNVGPEVGVAATKTFTGELAILYQLALTMSNSEMSELESLPDVIRECLATNDAVSRVGAVLAKSEHVYFISKGLNFATAGECALKMKEISYIHAESMAAGELKHGTLSLIEPGTPVVGLCPNDNMYDEMISSLTEAKSRGAFVVGLSDKNNALFDQWLKIPAVPDLYYPVPLVVIGQLLAYYTAVARGLNPDRPRSLAKSVTVL